MLDNPALGGGIQQVSDCLSIYLKRTDRNDQTVIEYGERLGSGAVFKRLSCGAATFGWRINCRTVAHAAHGRKCEA
ncbi:hypothetical protein [Bradyrhizobium sp. DASA03007]|uniref:hypothetical protein n=1 Tax=unclassified Bradyrhizobium TaxID=2631580 RepID=UPI003F6FF220